MDNSQIKNFVERLANTKVKENSTNQFSYDTKENEIRRTNLTEYLKEMSKLKPKILLVSEAPGYLGMRITGVPFTSENILDTHSFFKSNKKFEIANKSKPGKEQSATIVWNTIGEINKETINKEAIPLMWPSFPFHPHKANNKNSNRKPTVSELENGKIFLEQIIEHFNFPTIIAVGKVAQDTLLKELKIEAQYIRHPANGGAREFHNGLLKEIAKHPA